MRIPTLVAAVAVAVSVSATPAIASWVDGGSGQAGATAGSLTAPTGVGAVPVAPTSSAIDITWTTPANKAGTTYAVSRDKTASGAPGPVTLTCTASPCHDTGLGSGVTFTYTVQAVLGAWSAASASATTATTGALTVTSATVTGSGKAKFAGTGAAAGTVLSVAVCRAPVLTCTSLTPGYVETVTLTPSVAGSWQTPQTSSKLTSGQAYVATATQGQAISAAYSFTA